jgi:hypothetical protein
MMCSPVERNICQLWNKINERAFMWINISMLHLIDLRFFSFQSLTTPITAYNGCDVKTNQRIQIDPTLELLSRQDAAVFCTATTSEGR